MTRKLHALLLAASLLAAPAAPAVAPDRTLPAHREGEVLVRYKDGPAAAGALALKSRLGLQPARKLRGGRIELLALPALTTTAAALELLRRDPAVSVAEPNFLRYARALPNDPLFGDQWGLHSTGQANFADPSPALASIPGADLDMIAAWDPDNDGIFDRTGDGLVTIAIVDDGVYTGHPDLAANIVAGFDFLQNDTDPSPNASTQQHGTFVAGAAGAIGNNGLGVAGTAWNVKLMPLKFNFDTADHIDALAFARDNGADIVNASFGGPGFSQLELDAIRNLADNDILYVAAAGNDDSNTDFGQLNYPANYDAANIVSVAATNRQDRIASFSQYGAITTDVAAPGLQIVTTSGPNGYTTNPGIAGTSFSSPYTAGIAALLKSHVDADPGTGGRQPPGYAEMKARLIEGAEVANEVNLRTASGRVNAKQALDLTARPSLVIEAVDWVDANNGVLDPGESLSVDITLHNLWRDATNVSGTLTAAGSNVAVTSGAVSFGDIDADGSATATFDLTVATPIVGHRYVFLTLELTADGGYAASRGLITEIGRLESGTTVEQAFASRDADLYDEFHAWHFDLTSLPAGHNQLVIETTSDAPGTCSPDIDLLVKRDVPPQYNITVGINPETDSGFFCTSGTTANCQDPNVLLSADADGDEIVVLTNPPLGTYHAVVVNFAQLDGGMDYTIKAYTRASAGAPAPVNRCGGGGGGGGGGGAPSPVLLAGLLAAAALRRRR